MEKISHFEKYIYFYLLLSMVCWGISWPTSKILTQYTDTFTLMFLKFFLSSLSIISIVFLLDIKKFFDKKIIKPLFLSSIFIIIYNILFFYALKIGYAGLGGIIVTGSNPIFTFLLVAFIEKVKITKTQKAALILGIIGTAITVNIFSFNSTDILKGGNLLFLISSLLWSLVTLFSTKGKEYLNSILFTLYLYLISSIFTFLFLTDMDKIEAIFSFDTIFWANLIFTTVITTGFATTFYFKASNILGANHASSFIFLVPLIAAISSVFMVDEVLSLSTLAGGVILILAVWLLNKGQKSVQR